MADVDLFEYLIKEILPGVPLEIFSLIVSENSYDLCARGENVGLGSCVVKANDRQFALVFLPAL